MIKKYNYFIGMRITTNNALVDPNTDSKTKSIIEKSRNSIFLKSTSISKASSGINKTLSGF